MKILIVVDVQNDFTTGALGTAEAQAAIPAIKKKISEYETDSKNVIFFTRDTHFEDYLDTSEGKFLPVKHCIEGSWGHQIVEGVFPKNSKCSCFAIDKPTFGYIEWYNAIIDYLEWNSDTVDYKDIESIEIIGFCTDICVISNVLVIQAGIRTFLPNAPKLICDASCCAGVTPEKHLAALEIMKSCQIEVINE